MRRTPSRASHRAPPGSQPRLPMADYQLPIDRKRAGDHPSSLDNRQSAIGNSSPSLLRQPLVVLLGQLTIHRAEAFVKALLQFLAQPRREGAPLAAGLADRVFPAVFAR